MRIKHFFLKLPRPNGRGIFKRASSELKPAEAENVSTSHDHTIGDFRVGGLSLINRESTWVILLIIILSFFSYAPIIRNYINAPSNRYYWGSVEYPIDQIGNLTNIREGYLGHWLRFPKVTSTIEGKPSLIKFESILIGQIARASRVDPLIMYHLTRIVLSLLTLIFIYFFIRNIYTTKIERIVGFIFVLFATSITLPFDWSIEIIYNIPFDIYAFMRLTNSSHHYILGILFSLISLFYLSKVIEGGRRITYFILAAVFGMFTSLVYSPSAVLIILSLPIFWCILLFKKRISGEKAKIIYRKMFAIFICLVLYIGITIIPIFYYRYISQFWEFNMLNKIEKIVPSSFLPWQYIYLAGVTYFLSVISIPYVLKRGNTLLLMLIPWVVIHPLAVYLLAPQIGINITRFFMTAYFVVFAILAVSGINYLTEIIRRVRNIKLAKRNIFIIVTVIVIASGIFTYKRNSDILNLCFCLKENFTLGYPKKEVMEGVFWLRDNTSEDDIVLSGFYAGMLIPAFAGNKVYISWWFRLMEMPALSQTYQASIRFYSKAMSDEEARIFLTANKIAYIFWGDEERQELSQGKELYYPFLQKALQTNSTIIYSVKL